MSVKSNVSEEKYWLFRVNQMILVHFYTRACECANSWTTEITNVNVKKTTTHGQRRADIKCHSSLLSMNLSKREMAFNRRRADTLRGHYRDQIISNDSCLGSAFSLWPHLFVSLACVTSNQSISRTSTKSKFSPESSPSTVRLICNSAVFCRWQTMDIFKWWRWFIPLRRISSKETKRCPTSGRLDSLNHYDTNIKMPQCFFLGIWTKKHISEDFFSCQSRCEVVIRDQVAEIYCDRILAFHTDVFVWDKPGSAYEKKTFTSLGNRGELTALNLQSIKAVKMSVSLGGGVADVDIMSVRYLTPPPQTATLIK